ncbi:MAG: hypothetical protein LUQ64_00805, partial [Methanomicrobiales archaeon]|nr:hypothetical protein [Methanomicrobiales archaeon]
LVLTLALVLGTGCTTTPSPQASVPTTTAPGTVTTAAGAVSSPEATTTVYVSRAYGYRITYPRSCTLREEDGGATVIITTPAESASDTFRENLRIAVQDLSASPMDLDTFVDSEMAIKKQGLASFNPILDGPVKIGTTNGRKLSYRATLGSTPMQWVEIYTIRGLTAYTLTFTAEESHYRFYVEGLDQTLKSFTLT